MIMDRVPRRVQVRVAVLVRSIQSAWRYLRYCQQLGTNWAEKASITSFVLRNALAYRSPITFMPDDATLHAHGAIYTLGLKSGEFVVFEEIYFDHIYDRIGDFISQPSWTVFDVGANVGLFAVQQARRGALVYAFEPNPDCYRRMSKTVAQNGLIGMVRLFDEAVGAEVGSVMLTVPAVSMMKSSPMTSTTTGSILPITEYPTAHSFSVRVTSLDYVVSSLDVTRIELLKIDVEGAEIEVLRGAEKTLEKVERIIIEYHSHELRDQVRDLLQSHQFSQVLQIDSRYEPVAGLLYYAKHSYRS